MRRSVPGHCRAQRRRDSVYQSGMVGAPYRHRQGGRLQGLRQACLLYTSNWTRYSREATLYADLEVYEDGVPQWSTPKGKMTKSTFGGPPNALALVEAMQLAGMFDRKGVDIVHGVWGRVDFVNSQGFEEQRQLTEAMFEQLSDARLLSDAFADAHGHTLYSNWQIPMYALDFREVEIPLEDLEARREAAFWSEVGY